jgi:hypothetical protein
MGKGMGTTQRLILDTLQKHGPYYLAALAGGNLARYKSLHRAAMKLYDAGQVGIITFKFGQPKIAIAVTGDDSLAPKATPVGTLTGPVSVDRDQLKRTSNIIAEAKP